MPAPPPPRPIRGAAARDCRLGGRERGGFPAWGCVRDAAGPQSPEARRKGASSRAPPASSRHFAPEKSRGRREPPLGPVLGPGRAWRGGRGRAEGGPGGQWRVGQSPRGRRRAGALRTGLGRNRPAGQRWESPAPEAGYSARLYPPRCPSGPRCPHNYNSPPHVGYSTLQCMKSFHVGLLIWSSHSSSWKEIREWTVVLFCRLKIKAQNGELARECPESSGPWDSGLTPSNAAPFPPGHSASRVKERD